MLNAATAALYSGIRGPRLGGRGGGGLGHLGSFLVYAAIWHIVGQAVATVFRRFPALGALAAFLLVGAGLFFAVRWLLRCRNAPTNLSAAAPATGTQRHQTTAQRLGYSAGRCASSRPDRRPLNVPLMRRVCL